MWTRFMDMHSGGGRKEEPYALIFIEADEEEAKRVFFAKFGHNPQRVSCTCCGEDYSISSKGDFESLSLFDRRGFLGRNAEAESVERFRERRDVLIIHAEKISVEERRAYVPVQGFVWAG